MTHRKKQARIGRSRLMPWTWLGGMLGLVFAGAALAADPLYENDSVMIYNVPPNNLPVIDATNFLNNNWFEVTFASTKGGLNMNAETYETEDTVNFTNIGTMVANSSILTNGSGLILNYSPGCGFNFDTYNTQSGLEHMAGSFYNPGNIRANSAVDLGINALLVSTIGKCLVNATNIVVPGTIQLGENSLMQLTGKSVDLTRARLVLEGFGAISPLDYGVGLDTNQDWVPSIDLGTTYALSSIFLTALGYYQDMYLTNSTPYFYVDNSNPNTVIVRAIFLQNQLTNNVTAKVFWAQPPFPTYGGDGLFNIEWDGTYVDASTGQTVTHYLYLNDNNVLGSRNPVVVGGIPENFMFIETNQELFLGVPAVPSYPAGVFMPYGDVVTNSYSYASVQLIPTTAATNNPTTQQNVTNYLSQVLPGRIQISAESNLDLSLAQISGQNYLSLRATNQFNGSVGAQIFSPYSDINLGVTNGFMTVTNLMEPLVPFWNGAVQCWSARWIYVDTTVTPNMTNDYRVLLVNSSLVPTTPSEIQDLKFHATNGLVISDVLNILRSVSIDAQNLTLTTNGPNAASPDGELNLQLLPTTPTAPVNYVFVWSNAFPKLHNLTNSGAIRMPNVNPVNIGSASSPYGAFINHGFISDNGVILGVTNFESDGIISNSVSGSFILRAQTATLTNGLLYAGGDVSITSGSLVASNLMLQANRSLTLTVATLTDTGPSPTNGNNWVVGSNSVGSGFSVPVKPVSGDLLGTTVTLFAPANVKVVNTWAANDLGVSNAGYTNNVAIGHLVLDAQGPSSGTQLSFNGVAASNAIYVDRLELRDYASYTNHDSHGNLAALAFNTNLVIYYADAIAAGAGDVSLRLNHKNGDHLRWVPTYAGYFSSTNLVYLGATNAFNVALAESSVIDSNGNGIPNASDPTPFTTDILSPGQISLASPQPGVLTWHAVPPTINYIYYSTNLASWQTVRVVTNYTVNSYYPYGYFSGYDNSTNSGLVNTVMTNTVSVPVAGPMGMYRVSEVPWLTYPY
jgi:hypothetical protein